MFSPRIGLKIKMTVLFGGLVSVVLIIIGTITVIREKNALEEEYFKIGVAIARDIASDVKRDMLERRFNALQEHIGHALLNESVLFAMVLDMDGYIVAHSDEKNIGKKCPASPTQKRYQIKDASVSAEFMYESGVLMHDVVYPIKDGSVDIGFIHMGYSHEGLDALIKRSWLEVTLIVGIASFFSFIISYLIAHFLVRPIEMLITATRKIAQGDYEITFKTKAPDEIGTLSHSFEVMAFHLRATTVSRDFVNNIFNSAGDAMFVVDLNYKISAVNRSMERFLGAPKDEIIGKKCHEFFPRDKCGSGNCCLKMFASGHGPVQAEINVTLPDGRQAFVRHRATPFLDRGHFRGMVVSLQDITEQMEAQKALQRSQNQLFQAQKMEALGTLVAGVAHEINNPVSLILFNAPLVNKVWKDLYPVFKKVAAGMPDKKYGGLTLEYLDANFSQLLMDTEIAAKRIAKINTDLKNFARQSYVIEKEVLRLNDTVEEAIRLARSTIKKSGVMLKTDFVPGLPDIYGNAPAIEQVVLNLIINAVHAIDHDEGIIVVRTGIAAGKGKTFFEVQDNGKGVNPEITETLFDPFVTDKQAEGGTGLGLSVSYSLVQALNGEILFGSKIGFGSTFRVELPVYEVNNV